MTTYDVIWKLAKVDLDLFLKVPSFQHSVQKPKEILSKMNMFIKSEGLILLIFETKGGVLENMLQV